MSDNDITPAPSDAEIEALLDTLLDQACEALSDDDDPLADIAEPLNGLIEVRTFGDAALLTRERGLVLRFADGTEFQITIVQTR